MRQFSWVLCIACAACSSAVSWAAPESGTTETFNVSTPTKVPGATLDPGSYTIKLVNRLSDRDILEIDSSAGGAVHTTFIGIPNQKTGGPASSKLVPWTNPADGGKYLRGWHVPNSSGLTEFVYPKEAAVTIAKSNQAQVPAIDPASEGRVADPSLSSEDMRLITLWLLSSTTVGPAGGPGIKAEKFQTASNSIPQPPPVKRLPHTASEMPVVLLAGFGSLAAAGMLRMRRLQACAVANPKL